MTSIFCKKQGVLLGFLFLLTACASLKKSEDSSLAKVHPQDIQLFESAFQDLGLGNYESALPQFQKLAKKYKGQDIEWPALYNLGSVYKEMGLCAKAQGIYEQLSAKMGNLSSRSGLKKPSEKTISQIRPAPYPLSIKPRLHLSLAYVYECLGEREKSLKALKEGDPYKSYLTKEARLIEYPARLSLAYIAVGQKKMGLKIQRQVYQNLESLKNTFRISQTADESFALYFYTIGRSHIQLDKVDLPHFLKVFPYHQAYLVQAVLLKAGKWSIRAEKELGDLYRKMWAGLKKQKKNQPSAEVQNILQQLKLMTQGDKTQKMALIYRGLRKKTLGYLKG